MRNSIYKLMEYDQATPAVQKVYDESKQLFGIPFVLNWLKCQGSNEQLLIGNWTKLKNTLVLGKVPNLLKQLIIFNVSHEKNCNYCTQAHAIFANLLGKSLSADPGFRVTDDLAGDLLPQSYRVAVKVVTKAALKPATLNDDDIDELFEAGFDSEEIKELMAQADLVNMLNTIADISGIKLDNELLELVN